MSSSTKLGDEDVVMRRLTVKDSDVELKMWSSCSELGAVESQYWPLYFDRLKRLRSALCKRAQGEWPTAPVADRVLDAHSKASEVVIIGTLVKEMKLRPSPLVETKKENALFCEVTSVCVKAETVSLISGDDSLTLEDENGSVAVSGQCLEPALFVTGLCVALRGELYSDEGVFVASGVLLPGIPPPTASPLAMSLMSSSADSMPPNAEVLLVSGLNVGSPKFDALLLDVLCDFVCNERPSIVRLIIAGDSVDSHSVEDCSAGLSQLDACIARMGASVAVDLMPGAMDPFSNATLPQTPFHKCLLPMAASLSTVRRASNPMSVKLFGRAVLGCSGQNVADMLRVSRLSEMECLRLTLESRILAPTAPDTLSCVPVAKDPFVIDNAPTLYFASNCQEFKCGTVADTTLLTLPSFARSGQCALFNLSTRKCELLHFNTDFIS